jgi:hypothetical protein
VILNEAFGDRVKHRQLDSYYTVSHPVPGGALVIIISFQEQEIADAIPLEDIPREILEIQNWDPDTYEERNPDSFIPKMHTDIWREGIWIPYLQARLKLGR